MSISQNVFFNPVRQNTRGSADVSGTTLTRKFINGVKPLIKRSVVFRRMLKNIVTLLRNLRFGIRKSDRNSRLNCIFVFLNKVITHEGKFYVKRLFFFSGAKDFRGLG